ncbi:uncharacterized protein ACHE_10981S [Aspergillus chevalieri]|uniref:Protein kinase domain-containing protein n=1 Tax=Aspergillus chevalieri TaxID=182096 RepID=A0A7R7VF93_ASPCH|nr:uncharacterized protein ACHE_10981S [Aspergillus chevalieri]BCR83579.1 hypothetical protein ACHE_10981S [Aspergillus chevalieri]
MILAYLRPFQIEHITNLRDMDGSRLTLYIDYIAGRDLSKMVTENGFSQMTESQGYDIWQDAVEGLKHLHKHNVNHHDLKPENIVILLPKGGRRRAVLCDFGIATIGPKMHYNGTPSYISPDIMVGKIRSAPDDIWALGVTMLFVFGFIPLPKHSWIIQKIEEGDPKTLLAMTNWKLEIRRICQKLPERLGLLQCMLNESRAKRITASQLSERL